MWYAIPNMLMPFRQASLPIVEIASARAKQSRSAIYPFAPARGLLNNNRVLSLRSWSLADAIIRSSATREPGFFEQVWLGTAQWMRTVNLLEVGNGGRLTVRLQALLALRDANQTAWSADIGQAFCWLMGMRQLKFQHIVDFAEGCTALRVRPPRRDDARPDFLAQNSASSNVHLLESKGHLFTTNHVPDWKGDLRMALAQCDAGIARLSGIAVGSAYAIATALQPPTGKEHSQIVFADPDGPTGREARPDEVAVIATRHYAAWATCAGAMNWARALLELREHEPVGSEIAIGDRKFFFPQADAGAAGLVLPQHGPFVPCPADSMMMRGIDLGVAKKLARFPSKIKTFDMYPEPSDGEDFEILGDGTCLVSLARFFKSAPSAVRLVDDARLSSFQPDAARIAPLSEHASAANHVEIQSLAEAVVERFASRLADSDDKITSLIAETNASGFDLDEVELLSVGPLDLVLVRIPFRARAHFTGKQHEDRVAYGDSISAEISGTLEFDGSEWQVADYEIDAEIDYDDSD